MSKKKLKVVGHSDIKVDGLGLVCGTAKYTADWDTKDKLYLKMLTSPHAHARIINIDTGRATEMAGIVEVFTHENVPRIPHTTAGQGYPEPSPYDSYLFDTKVRFVGDFVAGIVAESDEIARKALTLIDVEYEVLPAVLDMEEAMKEGAPVIHDEEDARIIIPVPYEPERNLVARVDMNIGDVEKAFSDSDVVVEETYYAHYAQHCPIPRRGRQDRDSDIHAGTVPCKEDIGPGVGRTGEEDPGDQAPYRRWFRYEAGGASRALRCTRCPQNGKTGPLRVHQKGGVHIIEDPSSYKDSIEDQLQR